MSRNACMDKSKPNWKLVSEFPVTTYRCGARAGEPVRLRRELAIRDHNGRLTGKFHPVGETWTVVLGAAEEPRVLWLRQADGAPHTWDDTDEFWDWFERISDSPTG